jgi:hypothetical protein
MSEENDQSKQLRSLAAVGYQQLYATFNLKGYNIMLSKYICDKEISLIRKFIEELGGRNVLNYCNEVNLIVLPTNTEWMPLIDSALHKAPLREIEEYTANEEKLSKRNKKIMSLSNKGAEIKVLKCSELMTIILKYKVGFVASNQFIQAAKLKSTHTIQWYIDRGLSHSQPEELFILSPINLKAESLEYTCVKTDIMLEGCTVHTLNLSAPLGTSLFQTHEEKSRFGNTELVNKRYKIKLLERMKNKIKSPFVII